jgi:TRAP-type mannitol/chloroaromatic compound transport system substrate-binding protein
VANRAAKAQELAAKAGLTDLALKSGELDQLHSGWVDAAGSVDDYLDKESGVFNTSKYISAMKKRQRALQEYADTLASSDLTPEAKSYIESLGAEQAAAMMQGYKNATPAQRRDLKRIWTAAGHTTANSFTDALGEDLRNYKAKVPPLIMDKDELKRQMQEARNRAQEYLNAHPLQAGAVAYDTHGKPIMGKWIY